MNDIVIGVDVGGSKTHVLVSTYSGKTLADVTGPGAAMTPGDADHCASMIAAVIADALTQAKQPQERQDKNAESIEDDIIDGVSLRPSVIVAGVAGTGREAEQRALHTALTRLDIADDVIVETDATVALIDAFGENPGIVLVAGTGSIAFGVSPAGVHARCGGWGLAIGDEGSGAWIGRKALGVVAAAHDGREPETMLLGALLTAAQVNDVEELIPWSIAANHETLAALTPSVIAVAMQGDLRANAIIDMAVEELMLHVRALGRRLFIDERAAFDVALAGGLLQKGGMIRKQLEKRLKQAVPGATIKPDVVNSARGAVRLARAQRL